jgi:hypothetical protein
MKSFTLVMNLATMRLSAHAWAFIGWFSWIEVCRSGEVGADVEKNSLEKCNRLLGFLRGNRMVDQQARFQMR